MVVTVTSTGTAVCNASLGCCTETVSPLSLLSYAGSSFQPVWVATFNHSSSRSCKFDLSLRKKTPFLDIAFLGYLVLPLDSDVFSERAKGKALDYTGYSEGGSGL